MALDARDLRVTVDHVRHRADTPSDPTVHTPGRDVLAAVATGQFAGLGMLAAMMAGSVLQGLPVLQPIRSIGSILYPTGDLQGGSSPLFLGLVVHQLGFSLSWSLAYAALVRFADRRHIWNLIAIGLGGVWGAAALGPLVGMASQVVDVLLAMQWVAPGEAWTHTFLGLWSWVYHLVFGLGLAAFPFVRRRLFPSGPAGV